MRCHSSLLRGMSMPSCIRLAQACRPSSSLPFPCLGGSCSSRVSNSTEMSDDTPQAWVKNCLWFLQTAGPARLRQLAFPGETWVPPRRSLPSAHHFQKGIFSGGVGDVFSLPVSIKLAARNTQSSRSSFCGSAFGRLVLLQRLAGAGSSSSGRRAEQ